MKKGIIFGLAILAAGFIGGKIFSKNFFKKDSRKKKVSVLKDDNKISWDEVKG